MTRELTVRPVAGLPELTRGDDLVGLLLAAPLQLTDGDVLAVSSKAVAKVEGRVVAAPRAAVMENETDRLVARHEALRIVRTRRGEVLAAAGVDESNTAPGTVVPLPLDPDGSARRIRTKLADRAGRNVAVVVTDTAGRAWRMGQTDLAVGCAGLDPVHDLAGTPDAGGRPLVVTAPAVADELAGAAALVLAKAAGTPVAVLSGLADLVLPAGEHGPGAAALVRPEAEDLFGLGSRDAVAAATRRSERDRRGFPSPAAEPSTRLAELVELAGHGYPAVQLSVERSLVHVRPADRRTATDRDVLLAAGAVAERLAALGWAEQLDIDPTGTPPGAVLSLTVTNRP